MKKNPIEFKSIEEELAVVASSNEAWDILEIAYSSISKIKSVVQTKIIHEAKANDEFEEA